MVYRDVDPVKQVTVLDAQWSNLPQGVVEEVHEFWRNMELGNDYYYAPFDVIEDEDSYPLIAEYLRSRGIENCLLHFWW